MSISACAPQSADNEYLYKILSRCIRALFLLFSSDLRTLSSYIQCEKKASFKTLFGTEPLRTKHAHTQLSSWYLFRSSVSAAVPVVLCCHAMTLNSYLSIVVLFTRFVAIRWYFYIKILSFVIGRLFIVLWLPGHRHNYFICLYNVVPNIASAQ